MPYHADSTAQELFIEQHMHTPTDLTRVICSLCRQRCGGRHTLVQISAHPECQCVFGRTCILQWLRSGSASSNTCPSCKAVLYNPQRDEDDSELDSDSEDQDDDGLGGRGSARGRSTNQDRHRRGDAPSPSPSSSSSSSSSSDDDDDNPRQGASRLQHIRNFNPPSRRQSSPSPSSSSSSSTSSGTLSAGSNASTSSTEANAPAIENLVDDLWTGTWDLVVESWNLTPVGQRARSITRAQLAMLVAEVYPFDDDLHGELLERLVLRARRMVQKHRSKGVWDGNAELRCEREDVTLAVTFRL